MAVVEDQSDALRFSGHTSSLTDAAIAEKISAIRDGGDGIGIAPIDDSLATSNGCH
jgi:hypothetical protein